MSVEIASTAAAAVAPAVAAGAVATEVPKPALKICCACPETKKARDECIVVKGEEQCAAAIEAHKVCLRAHRFNV